MMGRSGGGVSVQLASLPSEGDYKHMKVFYNFLAGAALASVGFLVGTAHAGLNEPSCPTEDSCAATYDHGHWTITEVTP